MFHFIVKIVSLKHIDHTKPKLKYSMSLSGKQVTPIKLYDTQASFFEQFNIESKKIPKKVRVRCIFQDLQNNMYEKMNVTFELSSMKKVNFSTVKTKKAEYRFEWNFFFNALDLKMALLGDYLNNDVRFVVFFYYNDETKEIRKLLSTLLLFHENQAQDIYPFLTQVGERMTQFQKKLHITLQMLHNQDAKLKSVNNCGLFLFEKILEILSICKKQHDKKKTLDQEQHKKKKKKQQQQRKEEENAKMSTMSLPVNPKKSSIQKTPQTTLNVKPSPKQNVQHQQEQLRQKQLSASFSQPPKTPNPPESEISKSMFESPPKVEKQNNSKIKKKAVKKKDSTSFFLKRFVPGLKKLLNLEAPETGDEYLQKKQMDELEEPQSAPVILKGSEREKIKNKKIFYDGNLEEDEGDDGWVVLDQKKEFSDEKILNPENEI